MDANERRARATHEATQWWNRLGVERPSEVSRADRELFTQWLRESPLHVAELLRIAHVHNALERFKLWGEIETGDAGESHNVISLREASTDAASGNARSAEERSAAEGRAHRSRVTIWAIAASICFVAVMGGWFALGTRGQAIETELAERRQVMLDDGTVVQLEPETRLRVKFEDHARYVGLERGRALFRVAKDAQRPFWVSTDHTTVRAVGTAFGVEKRNRGVIVTVAEGKVAVGRSRGKLSWSSPTREETFVHPQRAAPGEGPSATTDAESARSALPTDERPTDERPPDERNDASSVSGAQKQALGSSDAAGASAPEIFLTAGQQVTVRSSGVLGRVRAVDTVRALAWAHGELVFENDTLADIVGEFNRYNRTQLHISDPQLATRRVSGVFEATDTETLLAFIRQGGSDISVTQTDEGIVIGSNRR